MGAWSLLSPVLLPYPSKPITLKWSMALRGILLLHMLVAIQLLGFSACDRRKDSVGPSQLRGRIVYTELVNNLPQLFVIHPDDPLNPSRVLDSNTEDLAPKWSPDGTRIAFLSDREGLPQFRRLYTVSDDGTDVRGLFDPVIHPEGDLEFSWAPDGKHIALINNVRGFRTDRRQLFIMDLATLTRQRVADALPNRFAPDWSPDGTRIAFLTDVTGLPAATLHLLSYPALELSTVDVGIDRINFPRWSPDGQSLAFLGAPGNATEFQVFIAEGTSLIPRQVTSMAPGIATPAPLAWSPDGGRILFSGPGTNVFNRRARDLYSVNADGTGLTRFTFNANDESGPDWTVHE